MALKVKVLEESFRQVKPHGANFAASFYENLFADCPQARPLFANTNMEKQQEKLLESLSLIIFNLRYPGYLENLLKDLGERHVRYGTLREHYPIVGAALLKTLKSYLGANWTPEVKQAWTDAYEKIADLMLEGAERSEPTFSSENEPQQSNQPIETEESLSEIEAASTSKEVPHQSSQTIVKEKVSAPTFSFRLKPFLIIFGAVGLLLVGIFIMRNKNSNDTEIEINLFNQQQISLLLISA